MFLPCIIISDELEPADSNQAIKILECGYLSRSEVSNCPYEVCKKEKSPILCALFINVNQ